MHGRIIDAVSKKPVVGAIVDIWQASTNGLYEQQDKGQVDHNLRGKFTTNEEGVYELYCLKPTPYPIPDDGKSTCSRDFLVLKTSLYRSGWEIPLHA